MGDRGNIVIKQFGSDERVYLYTHWRGTELPTILRDALASEAGRRRWNDNVYLARIIFTEMQRNARDPELGFGISTRLTDNEHPILVVDCEAREVRVEADPDGRSSPAVGKRWSFEDYVKLPFAHHPGWEVLETHAET